MSTVPLFSLLPHNGSYPPSPTFSDPAFSYDPHPHSHGHGHGSYTSPLDLKGSNSLGNFAFPTPPSTSTTTSDNSYSARLNPPFPNLLPPTFNHSHSHPHPHGHGHGSFPTPPEIDDPTSFLDLDLSQPGPSTYHRIDGMYDHLSTSHGGSIPSGPGSGSGSGFDLDDGVGAEYVQQLSDDEESGSDQLVKYESHNGLGGVEGEEGEGEGEMDNEEPLYVNAKQYHRILKRRLARARLEELNRLVRSRKPYLHESRHRHACSRPRGKGGRFLTADEIEAMKKEEAEKGLAASAGEGDSAGQGQ